MPKAYSCELRERVIAAVETRASRREAAEHFAVTAASAVKWLQRWREMRSAAAKPRKVKHGFLKLVRFVRANLPHRKDPTRLRDIQAPPSIDFRQLALDWGDT
jgi:Transposase